MNLILAIALAASSSFVPGPSMLQPRRSHTATLLHDGRVLIAGGHFTDARCELYDPATRTFRWTAALSRPRPYATATLLRDGRVLIIGGGFTSDGRGAPFGSYGDPSAEIFDPATETFTPAGPMAESRYAHAATLLDDGRVLVTGGGYGYIGGIAIRLFPRRTVEIYDPTTNNFTTAPPMITARWYHTATTLRDGTVLLMGTADDVEVSPAGEVYDLTTSREVLGFRPRFYGHAATLLRDGRVLIVAGGTAEIYDPATRVFHSAGSTGPWEGVSATLLPNGNVLLTGSSGCEIFDPDLGVSVPIEPLAIPRRQHTATLMRNGSVLIAGGMPPGTGLVESEIYTPQSSRRRNVRP